MKKVIIDGIEYIPKEIEIETWTDPDTGLVWEKQGSDQTMSWKEALKYAETLGDNWRLPTVQELLSLIDFSKVNPACKIGNTHTLVYWSSTIYAGGTYDAWHVGFYDGHVYYGYKGSNYYVHCIREGKK